MHVQAENVILEVDGSQGSGDALVTDLNNVLTPVVRYRLGDVIRLSDEPCPCGRGLPVLEAVEGRTQARYLALPDGGREHVVLFSYVIEDALTAGHPIEGFRIVQERIDAVLLEIVMNDPAADRGEVRSLLFDGISGRLPSSLTLRIEYRDAIPRSASGKVENFVPLAPDAGPRG